MEMQPSEDEMLAVPWRTPWTILFSCLMKRRWRKSLVDTHPPNRCGSTHSKHVWIGLEPDPWVPYWLTLISSSQRFLAGCFQALSGVGVGWNWDLPPGKHRLYYWPTILSHIGWGILGFVIQNSNSLLPINPIVLSLQCKDYWKNKIAKTFFSAGSLWLFCWNRKGCPCLSRFPSCGHGNLVITYS